MQICEKIVLIVFILGLILVNAYSKNNIDNWIYFFLRSCVHFGQNHFPLGFVVSPTQAKWNHSMGHWNNNSIL